MTGRSVYLVATALLMAGALLAPERFPAIAQTSEPQASAQRYTCPMHPHYISDSEGDCPICGMDVVAVRDGMTETTGNGAEVKVSASMVQAMGVITAPVGYADFGNTVRSFGAITVDERAQAEISSRVEGWVEDLRVRAVGDPVEAGDTLFSLYSPELISAQQDFLKAVESGSTGRRQATARRLRALGMDLALIETLGQRRQVFDTVPVKSPIDGTLSTLSVREGSVVRTGDSMLIIQNYEQVWLEAAVPESDINRLTPKTPARALLPSLPGREIIATVDYIYPEVDSRTRTGRVRLVLDNKAGNLRPGAYADVVFDVDQRERLAVPSSAVIRSAAGARVLLALGEGRFRAQPVSTGITASQRTEILAGLQTGQTVVVNGQFLLDSEASLQQAFDRLSGTNDLSETDQAVMMHIVDAALYLHEALADGYDPAADYLAPALDGITFLQPRHSGSPLGQMLNDADRALSHLDVPAGPENHARVLAELTAALVPWLKSDPAQGIRQQLVLYHDPQTDRLWLQEQAPPFNPYSQADPHRMPWPKASESSDDGQTPAMPLSHEHG